MSGTAPAGQRRAALASFAPERPPAAARSRAARAFTEPPATMSSPALLAVIIAQSGEAERRVLERFRLADATHPARARPLATLAIKDEGALAALVSAGVVREGAPGAYYLDESALAARHRSAGHGMKGVLVALLVAGVLALAVLVALRLLAAD